MQNSARTPVSGRRAAVPRGPLPPGTKSLDFTLPPPVIRGSPAAEEIQPVLQRLPCLAKI